MLVNYQTQLKKFHDDIQSQIIDSMQLEVDMEERDQHVLALSYTLSLLKDHIKNLKGSDVLNINIKTPRLDVPRFSREWAEWIHLRDSVKQIHDGRQYSNIDKIRYLSGQLLGEAKQLASGIRLGDNYDEMVQLLKESYGKTTVLRASHNMAFTTVEGPSEDLKALVSYRGFIEGHIRSFQILKVTTGEILTCLCHDKLSSNLNTIIKRANGDNWMNL